MRTSLAKNRIFGPSLQMNKNKLIGEMRCNQSKTRYIRTGWPAMCKVFAVLLCLLSMSAAAQKPKKTDVRLEIQPDPTGKTLVNWSITNNTKLEVYVFDFFLWGPAEWNEEKEDLTILGTAPSREEPGCPNRVAPVLLLVIAPGRTIHGDFIDDRLKLAPKAKVAMQSSTTRTRSLRSRSASLRVAARIAYMTPLFARAPSWKVMLFSCRKHPSRVQRRAYVALMTYVLLPSDTIKPFLENARVVN
jgi:hypothetical protein